MGSLHTYVSITLITTIFSCSYLLYATVRLHENELRKLKGLPEKIIIAIALIFAVFPSFIDDLPEPPSAPQNLKVNLVDQSSVILTWSEPLYLGGRNDTVYRVTCEPCTLAVAFSPARSGLTDTKVAVSGLNPTTTYRFQVFAENGVSNFDDSSQYVDISVTTEASGEAGTGTQQ